MINLKSTYNLRLNEIFKGIAFAFVIVFALTFDIYSKQFVTPETPFFNIAGLPFQRMEFVPIIFMIATAVGAVVGYLLKDKIKILAPLSLVFLGMITMFIGVFSVDTMQKLDPMMRISHVIMTVSRLTGIILASSGIFVGVIVTLPLENNKNSFIYSVIAMLLSMIALSENIYNEIYITAGVAIILIAILGNIFCEKINVSIEKNNNTLSNITDALVMAIFVFFLVYGFVYCTSTLGCSVESFASIVLSAVVVWNLCKRLKRNIIVIGILATISICLFVVSLVTPMFFVIYLTAIFVAATLGVSSKNESNSVIDTFSKISAGFLATIIGFVINHYTGEKIVHSNNRVIYQPSVLGLLIPLLLLICLVAIILFDEFMSIKNEKLDYKINVIE